MKTNDEKIYLAIDIGASGGKVEAYKSDSKELIEVCRFKNSFIEKDGHKCWDIIHIFQEVKNGIKEAFLRFSKIESLAIDTWGCDYVLLDENENIIKPVYAYRDSRTKDIIKEVNELIDENKLYEITGSQFQEFNTIYQLYKDKKDGRLKKAKDFLMIPEYLSFLLTGKKVYELTNSSTTNLLDIKARQFSLVLDNKLGFAGFLDKKLQKPGYIIGNLKEEIEKEVHGNLLVKLAPSHDTASAVEALKDLKEDSLYISSGTWSLLGTKLNNPITTLKAKTYNFSNELGPNYVRFQKNIMGLWIVQCLSKECALDFPEIIKLAKTSNFNGEFDVNDPRFLSPKNMKEEIINYFKERNIEVSKDEDIFNSSFISLACAYKKAIDEVQELTNKKYKEIYIIGGGAKNDYLNKLTEKITKKKVIALPIEASALGNIYSQIENAEEK